MGVPPYRQREEEQLERLRRWSELLDQAFRIPGTNVRFGWDVIVGLIPGIGDLSSPLFGMLLLIQAHRMRVPAVVQARMVINAIVDALLGLVPGLGNVADIFWKANTWNMRLLERHARPDVPHSPFDVVFVWSCILLLLAAAVLPIAVAVWVAAWIYRSLA
jgi:hypothetical protein